ncbi:DNA polymerase III subunit beta [Streptomyces sp. SID13031]|uniref:DNA polymerase III subunit beta n=1 Tax=Streptomyces sp. SID13031 TaxID=2706046 RepID=UPI0013CD75F5|nr:DNA polymerase III subunit beta [Streptomyces sp. SID13031]NEA34541.1 DNA polymerase III subunit beta [Streptomyces sp. SID13031]
MKVRVERDLLVESVAWVGRSLPSRPSVPILAGLLMEASEGQLTLSGFDYETSHRVTLPAQVSDPGRCLVSGRLVADIVKSLPHQVIDFSVDGAKALLVCGTSRFTLQTLPASEYPELPAQPPSSGVISSDVFARAVSQVAGSASRDDTMPVFTGVRMEIEGSTITLLATDRYRLAVRELEWEPDEPTVSATTLIPARALSDTAKAMTGSTLTLSLDKDAAGGDGLAGFAGEVSGGSRWTTTRLLDGSFPKVRNLMPEPDAIQTRVRIDTTTLVEAVKRVALVAERNAPVRITFTADGATLDAGNGDEAQASETIETHLTGDPVTVGFNPTYLLDGLHAIGTPIAHLAFVHPTKPAELTGATNLEEAPQTSFRYILMPVRLHN